MGAFLKWGCLGTLGLLALVVGAALASPPARGVRVGGQPAVQGAAATPAPKPTAAPIVIRGRGRTASERVTPPAPASVASFTHDGRSNFVVKAVGGSRDDLLINEIGRYDGQRPILSRDPVMFDIEADGNWTIRVEGARQGGSPALSGRGDAVSALFTPPSTGPWTIRHSGKSNFIVTLHCASRANLIQNSIGPMDGSAVVRFGTGPCMWEVEADGEWNLSPR